MTRSFMRSNRQRRRQAGVTLVELMVSMAIGLIIIAGLGYIYLSASNVFRTLEASARLQENVRYAFERITSDVRMAGFTGCSYNTSANVLTGGSASWDLNLIGRPIGGYEDTNATFPSEFSGSRVRGDALVLLRADNSSEYVIRDHNAQAASFKLTTAHDIKDGQIVVATDCKHAAIFQITNANAANQTLDHNPGASTPGNCTKLLKKTPATCQESAGEAYTFPDGARLLKFSGVAYFIGNSGGEPTLFRKTTGKADPEEVIDGIENMQILYGVDTTLTADGSVDTYTTADQVLNTLSALTTLTDDQKWARILAIRISLLVVSKADQRVSSQVVPYDYNGSTVTPTDLRLRKVFTTTIAVRNRLGGGA